MLLAAAWRGFAAHAAPATSVLRPTRILSVFPQQRGFAKKATEPKVPREKKEKKPVSITRAVTPLTLFMIDNFAEHRKKKAKNPELKKLQLGDFMPNYKKMSTEGKLELRARQQFIFDWFQEKGHEYDPDLRSEADAEFKALGAADKKKWLEIAKLEEERILVGKKK